MTKCSEQCFYTVLIIILLVLAVLIPVVVIRTGKTSHIYVYISSDNDNPKTPLDEQSKKHLEKYLDKYYTVDELYKYFDEFVRHRSLLLSKDELGETSNGETGIEKITMRKRTRCDTDRSKVLIVSGLAARDWGSVLTTIEIMNKLYSDVHKSNRLLNRFEFHFLPLMNPDGYTFSMSLPIYHNWKSGNKDDFHEGTNPAKGVAAFKDYFRRHKDTIKAAFFLFSPEVMDYKVRYFAFPEKFLGGSSCKEKVTAALGDTIAVRSGRLTLINISKSDRGRLDHWVIKETLSKPILVVSFSANFLPGPPEYLRPRIEDLGSDAHLVITTLLEAFEMIIW